MVQCSSSKRDSDSGDLTYIPYQPQPFTLQESDRFVKMQIPADNPLTEQGITLGRQLFFDPILSADSTQSCASCHQPDKAFTDGLSKSKGVHKLEGRRSAMSLVNVGYFYKGLFWDGRVPSLEAQALIPVEDSLEMGNTWEVVEKRLRQHPDYPSLFRQAFGSTCTDSIDRFLVAKAIAQYERTLVSYNAPYDQVMRGEAVFTVAEKRGFDIFFDASSSLPVSECGHCHLDPLFTNLDFLNNGIQKVGTLDNFPDKGRGAITGVYYDNGQFRVPSLRNIELTAPYMHDGRFKTLEAVIDHYASGGHFAENLNPNVRKLHLSARDKADLIAFLRTLTDTSGRIVPVLENPL
ncbi:MAG: methylamine utilization protein [Saprospiraceae bacterium]|nr:MAG: methylamine utilization protein [Saprospiraceae bacterium]